MRPESERSTLAPRPKLFLDVDGVLNRFGDSTTETLATVDVVVRLGSGDSRTYSVRYSPEILRGLVEIIDKFDVELVWLTTWLSGGQVVNLVDKLPFIQGGRLLPVPRGRWSGLPYRWKVMELVKDQRKRPAPFAWIDDEIHHSVKEARRSFDVPSLIIQPNPMDGLTAAHLRYLREFFGGLDAHR